MTNHTEHHPETWYWEADSEHCPHGPEPEDDTTAEWEEWTDRHVWAPQDVRVCLDAPVGDVCQECSYDHNDAVLWADCTGRTRQRAKGGVVLERPTRHGPLTLLVGGLECLDRECDDFFTDDGDERPEVEQCSHVTEEIVCAGCSTECSDGFWAPTVAWADCPRRPLAAPAAAVVVAGDFGTGQ